MRERQARAMGKLDAFAAALGSLSFVTLILHFGFPDRRGPEGLTLAWAALLGSGLFLEALLRLLVVADPWAYLASHPMKYLVLVMFALELGGVASWSVGLPGERISSVVCEVYLTVALLAHLGSWAKTLLGANRWLSNRKIPVMALSPISFAAAILAGAAILSLPGMKAGDYGFLDAAFTSASAICVTGLSTIDVAKDLTPLGQACLAGLIQVGGIGTLTIVALLALWSSGRLSIGERVAFAELVGGQTMTETRRIVGRTVKATLAMEAMGAFLMWSALRGKSDHPWAIAAFHSISAFCNAGFALFSDSLAGFAGDASFLAVVMLLVVLGGLGFDSLADLWRWATTRLVPWKEPSSLSRGTLFSLRAAAFLIAGGALAFLGDDLLSGKPADLLQELFQSVTLRAAGFQTRSQLALGPIGSLSCFILMAIGASPQSTGGGMKTTVAVRPLLRADWTARPGRRARPALLALVLAGGYLLLASAGGLLLSILDGIPPLDAFFECFSAIGTVGLSRDLTASLSTPSRLSIMFLMFTGRVLYPLAAASLARKLGQAEGDLGWA